MTRKPIKTTAGTAAIVIRPVRKAGRNEKSVRAEASNPAKRRRGKEEPTPDRRRKRNDAVTPSDRAKRVTGTTAAAVPVTAVPDSGRGSKKAICLKLLNRAEGASIEELMRVTGWQAHGVRGFLSGEVRKRLGKELTSAVTEQGKRRYRIAGATA